MLNSCHCIVNLKLICVIIIIVVTAAAAVVVDRLSVKTFQNTLSCLGRQSADGDSPNLSGDHRCRAHVNYSGWKCPFNGSVLNVTNINKKSEGNCTFLSIYF